MEHNPKINWHMGDISMTLCPASCRPKAVEERDQPCCISADKTQRQLKAHPHQWVHVEEVSESQSAHIGTEPPPGFTCPDPDELDKDDWLLIQFIGAQPEEIGRNPDHLQKLAEALGGMPSTCFKDIVPKLYQEFWDIFAKESFNKFPNQKQWDHAIELIPDTHNFKHICPLKWPMAITSFLHQEEGQEPMPGPRLLKSQCDDHEEHLPSPSDPRPSSTKSPKPRPSISWSWTSVGDTPICILKREMSGKTTFWMNQGLFKPLVMFFGLMNSPATFQTMMNDIFKELIDEGVVTIYMDNIFISAVRLKTNIMRCSTSPQHPP